MIALSETWLGDNTYDFYSIQIYKPLHYSDAQWVPIYLNSPACRLFVQQFAQLTSTETSKLRINGILWGNPPVNSPHKGLVMRNVFPWYDVVT